MSGVDNSVYKNDWYVAQNIIPSNMKTNTNVLYDETWSVLDSNGVPPKFGVNDAQVLWNIEYRT